MPSEDSGDVWCVGTEGQDGVWSVHLLKLSRHRGQDSRVLTLAPLSHHLEESDSL